ncbi:MAG TPA: zinc ribbon domain-containing protein [Pyrinomonadaceae bacterium]
MDNRYYPGVDVDVQSLVVELRRLYEEGGYEVQSMQVAQTVVLQARKAGMLRDLTGLSAALTIKITPEHGGTRVELGMQKWFDKVAVAGVVAMFLAAPLIALPALGAYWQHRLTEVSWKVIEAHITLKAGGYVPPVAGSCGTCGATNLYGAAFCATCGADLRRDRTCESCGAAQRDPSARFCNRCGKPLGAKA